MSQDLRTRARMLDIRLSLDGDRLICDAPASAEADALLEEIDRNKHAIVAALAAEQAGTDGAASAAQQQERPAMISPSEWLMTAHSGWYGEIWPDGNGPRADDAARVPLHAARWGGDLDVLREAILTDGRALLGAARGELDPDLIADGYRLCTDCGGLTRHRIQCLPCSGGGDDT